MTEKYDLLIIGSGPGGYVTAIRAAPLGMRVGMVEHSHKVAQQLSVGVQLLMQKNKVAVIEGPLACSEPAGFRSSNATLPTNLSG